MIGKKVLQQMQPYKQGMQISEVKRAYDIDRIVKLASNENPYGYSNKARQMLSELDMEYEFYPDGYAEELRVKLANKYNLDKDQFIFGAGSDEIITFICRAFLYSGVNTIMAAPTFPQYRHHALIEGAQIKEIPTKNGYHQLDLMAESIDANTKVVWLCTPDNPTGTTITQSEIDTFMKACPNDVMVVLDLAYDEYVDDEVKLDLHYNLDTYANLIILKTFSKAYGIAGLRVGYGVSSVDIANKLNVVRGPFNVTSFSLRTASVVLDDDAFIMQTKELNQQVRLSFQGFLDSINWGYYPSETNFLLVQTPIDADKVSMYLLQKGFIVRSGNVLGYPNTIRITIGKEADMKELQLVVKELDAQLLDGVTL